MSDKAAKHRFYSEEDVDIDVDLEGSIQGVNTNHSDNATSTQESSFDYDEVDIFHDSFGRESEMMSNKKGLLIAGRIANDENEIIISENNSMKSPTGEKVKIKEGVKSIGSSDYKQRSSLHKVSFPSTLETIDDSAFTLCKNLEEVDLSETKVTDIGRSSFKQCLELNNIQMPQTLKTIGPEAFNRCANLTTVDLSKTEVVSINDETFSLCDNLRFISFPPTLEKIGKRSFFECEDLTVISFPTESVLKSIQEKAFYGCGITTLIIPQSVKYIGEEAFGNCDELMSILIPKSTKVHPTAFIGCTMLPPFMLLDITWTRSDETDSSDDEEDISEHLVVDVDISEEKYKRNDLIQFVTVKEGVERIDACAFEVCTSLEKIELPSSLRKMGYSTFKGCLSLREIIIPENVEIVQNELLADCTSLEKVTLSSSTKYIHDDAFESCTSLKNIELPESVQDIQSTVFKECQSLKSIRIPSRVTYFGNSVFEGCKSLEKVEFSKGVVIDAIKEATFYKCKALKECKIPTSVTTIDEEAFFGCESLPSFNFHEGITLVGDRAFSGCICLEHIRLPRSVKKIGRLAFRGCKALRSVTFLNPYIEIEERAFEHCNALETIKGLPTDNRVVQDLLKKQVFFDCKLLQTPLGNELHLVAEGKCWAGIHYPPNSHPWIQHKLDQLSKIHKNGEHASFRKDYNGDTAFQCAVRGGAPNEYLKILAGGTNRDGKTHLDLFAEKYAMIQAEDYTEDEIAALKAENDKLIASTPIGTGKYYLDSFQLLLGSSVFDPRGVPEFIASLNDNFVKKQFAFVIMFDILMPLLRVIAYTQISDNYFDEGKKHHASVGWFVVVYISIFYLLVREFFQIREGVFNWVTDPWNWVDSGIIITTLISTAIMQKTTFDSDNYYAPLMKDFIVTITFFVWVYLVLKLRVVSVQFAVFVSGVINIIWTLLPFFVVSLLVLGAFAQMFVINHKTHEEWITFIPAFLLAYSGFLSYPGLPEQKDYDEIDQDGDYDRWWRQVGIEFVFGIFVVVLLLNVVIAVASSAWEGVTERGRDDFLLYRIKLFLELQDIFDRLKEISTWLGLGSKDPRALLPENNSNEMWKDSKTLSEVLARVRKSPSRFGGFILFGRILLNAFYILISPLCFGLTLSSATRRQLFTIDNRDAISDKRSHLQSLLKEAEDDLERLQKIEKHIQQNPNHEFMHLVDIKRVPSHFELKRKIRTLEKTVEKRRKDVNNYLKWHENLLKSRGKKNVLKVDSVKLD